MAQILVGGDNADAYSICDALEKETADRNLPVVFCATPQEVLANVGRGGVLAVVLQFEQAGLTNLEVAVRIREVAEGAAVPLLLPEIDALGDIGSLGKQVGTFAVPVNPGAVATLAGRLMEAAAKQVAAAAKPAASPKGQPRPPEAPASPAQSPSDTRKVPVAALTAPAASESAGAAPAAEGRRRRVRHRSWGEVQQDRRGGQRGPQSAARIDDDDIVVTGTRAPAGRRSYAKLGLLLLVVVLGAGAYYGMRAWRSDDGAEGEAAAAPAPAAAALTEVKCSACGDRDSRPAKNIHDERCRHCGKGMGFAYVCNDCKTEFAFVPDAAIKRLKEVRKQPECPKCKSWNTKALQAESKAHK